MIIECGLKYLLPIHLIPSIVFGFAEPNDGYLKNCVFFDFYPLTFSQFGMKIENPLFVVLHLVGMWEGVRYI